MARLPKEKKDDITAYAVDMDVRLDAAMFCNSTEEVDAVKYCLDNISYYSSAYNYAKTVQPKNPKEPAQRLARQLEGVDHPGKVEDIIAEFRALDPLYSEVLRIKDEYRTFCDGKLSEAGVGKKRRAKIIPALVNELTEQSTHDPSEGFDISELPDWQL